MPDKKFPHHIIPSLRDNEALRSSFAVAHRRTEVWGLEGKESDAEIEYGYCFEEMMLFCLRRLKEQKGRLKIVAFGSGQMAGVLDLRNRLVEYCKTHLRLPPNIEIVEYALTKRLALAGLDKKMMHDESQKVIENDKASTLRAHIGPLEVKDIADAQNADVVLSAYGPHYHADSPITCAEMIIKSAKKIAPGGEGFLLIQKSWREQLQNKLVKTIHTDQGTTCSLDVVTRTIHRDSNAARNFDSEAAYIHAVCAP